MTKISFIGAGSLEFTQGLVRDILTFPVLEGAEICLMDINAEGAEPADGNHSNHRAGQRYYPEG